MKGKTLNLVLTVLILVAFGLAMNRGFSFYQEYKTKIAAIDEQNTYIKGQLDDFSKNIGELKDTLGSLDSRIAQSADMANIDKRLASGEAEIKNTASQLESIKKEVQEWQQGYSSRLEELQAKINELKGTIETRGKATIDLGRVEIDKERMVSGSSMSSRSSEDKETNRGVTLQPR